MPRGRRPIYNSDEERKEAQRKHALKYYYRRKALREQLEHQSNDNRVESNNIEVHINANSKRLGPINEVIEFRRTEDGFIKHRVLN